MCCDGCPAAYHIGCIGAEDASMLPDPWYCLACKKKKDAGKPLPFEQVRENQPCHMKRALLYVDKRPVIEKRSL